MEDNVTKVCDSVMRAFAAALHNASEDSDLARARRVLGKDRFVDAAVIALRKHVKELITNAETILEDIRVAGPMAEQAALAGVVSDSIRDVIAEARKDELWGLL